MPEDSRKERESEYFSYFKKLYESWERSASQALDVWLKSPLFRNSMERAVEKSVEFKNYIQDTMERTLNQRYVPMRDDVNKLTGLLEGLEEKLSKLEEKIDDLKTAARKPTAGRKKTKSRIRSKRKDE